MLTNGYVTYNKAVNTKIDNNDIAATSGLGGGRLML